MLVSTLCFTINVALANVEISDGSIIGLFHLDDGVDSSGNGHNFSVSNGSFENAVLGNGFNTNNNGQLTGSSLSWNLSGDFTTGFFLTPHGNQTGALYVNKRQGGGETNAISYSIECTANHLEFMHNTQCKNDFAYTLASGTTYYLLITKTGNQSNFYINNQLESSVTDNQTSDGNFNTIINEQVSATNFTIDELFFRNSYTDTTTRDLLWNNGSGSEICVSIGCASGSSGTTTLNSIIMSTSTDLIVNNTFQAIYLLIWALIFFLVFYFIFKIFK